MIAYELLTGRRPFDAADPWMLAQQVTSGTTTLPSQIRPALAPAADETILRAMARRPDQRWPSVTAFVEALTKALAVTTVAAVGTSSEGPSLLSRYDVGESLGPGRLGSLVRRGTHRALGVPVAIRHLKREGQPHWDALRERFLREAQTLQVRHPNLLHVRDFGEDATGVFVVTDLVAGPSLRDRLAAGPLAWPLARQLIVQMVDAAAALHANGGLLTGVNPDTIRMTSAGGDEQLVLSSGGIRALGDVLSTMREPQLRGQESSELELPFIAPEVLTGRAPDARADVFTVGAIAVYLVTARPAVRGAEPAGVDRPDAPAGIASAVARRSCRQPRPQACAAVWPPIPPTAARSRICARRWPSAARAQSAAAVAAPTSAA